MIADELFLDFDSQEFVELSRSAQGHVCSLLAERAQELASKSPPIQTLILLNIASQWLHLADVIMCDTQPLPKAKPTPSKLTVV
jgi:hypothetical protein